MINFSLPGMYEHYNVLIPLCSLLHYNKEFFYDDIEINAVYGNFQFSAWDGGRIFPTKSYKHASREEIEKLKYIYNEELKIPMRLIFTSAIDNKELCYSYFDNLVCILCQDELNEIVVASPLLEEYLQQKYPKYSFISSTTKCLLTQEAIQEELLKDYKLICLDYNLNKNLTFLNSIPEDKKDKIEFLVNAICPPGCPSRKQHYYLNSMFNYSYGKPYAIGNCGITKSTLYPLNYSNNLSINEIIEYNKKGFVNFKLEGRTFDTNTLILELVKYLVKPEYQFYIIDFLLNYSNNFNLDTYNLESFKYINI